jgi:hypothetical protein
MTDEQITMLRHLIKDEIDAAQIDGMEHGQWGWAEKQLDEGWKEFQEEFAKSQVFDADKFAEENNMVRNHRILERYNMFYNTECSGLSHGTPITPEFQQAMTLECMLDALRYENLNHEFDVVSTADINALIEALYQREEGVE